MPEAPSDAEQTPTVTVHSVAEAYLYAMIAPCPVCAAGPLTAEGNLTAASDRADAWRLTVSCRACRARDDLRFRIDPPPTRSEAASDRINPTSARSAAIDLLGWMTLFRTIVGTAHAATDKQEARRLAGEALQCLDEALRFYDADNDLPPREAFFTEQSRRRFQDHPEQFLRSKLLHHRSLLPNAAARTVPSQSPPVDPSCPGESRAERPPRRWWRFWRRGSSS